MDINFPLMARLLERCAELRALRDVDPNVAMVYDQLLLAAATEFLAAHDALPAAEEAAAKEGREARAALEKIDQPYAVARSVSRAFTPDISLPDSLKAYKTDTDKKNAIQTLRNELDRRDETETWAANLLAGPFGVLAPEVIREVNEWIASNVDLSKAKNRRAQAFGPAYERFVDFKDVVRQVYGPSSREYRRIHLRNNDPAEDDNNGGGGGGGGGGT